MLYLTEYGIMIVNEHGCSLGVGKQVICIPLNPTSLFWEGEASSSGLHLFTVQNGGK